MSRFIKLTGRDNIEYNINISLIESYYVYADTLHIQMTAHDVVYHVIDIVEEFEYKLHKIEGKYDV